jgi:hypothetical protein
MTLVAAWNYGGSGATIPDLSGNGRSFDLTGTSTRTAAGGGYTYGGTLPGNRGLTQGSAEIQGGPPITGLNTSARTVATWVKTAPGDPSWFLEYHRNAEDTGVFGNLFLSGSLRARMKNPSNTAFERGLANTVDYRYVALVFDPAVAGGTFRAYQSDALDVLSQVGADLTGIGSVWDADVLRIFTNAGPGVTLSETRIFDTALSGAELSDMMTTPVNLQAPLGTATEADVAHAMNWAKVAGLGTAGEVDVAHALIGTKRPVFGTTTEADVAHAMTFAAGTGFDPVTDPEADVRPNPARSRLRPNTATSRLRPNPAKAMI